MAKVEVLNRSKSSIWQPNQPLKVKCQIQHRSDILMKEQVKNIEHCQDFLKMAVKGLKHIKSEDVQEKKNRIEEIEKNLEKQILILQVMEKINVELVYARADLDTALYENHGDINAARKRVIWLEDKMGELCGRKRITSKTPKKEVTINSVESEKTLENNEKLSDTNQLPEVDQITYPSESDPKHGTADAIGTDSVIARVTTEETEEQDDMHGHSKEQDTEIDHSEEEDKEMDHSEEEDNKSDHSEEQDKEVDHSEKDREREPSEKKTTDMIEADNTEFSLVKQSTSINRDQSNDDNKRAASPTFLTEVSAFDSLNTKPNRKGFVCTVEEDAARDYWKSEHHRLDLGDYFNELIDNDPLSYHNLGMAIPGCFIEREDSDYDDLPWRMRRRGSDIKDIHRIALDKLAVKLKKMYSKVYDAAMLSVLPSNKQAQNGDTTVTTNKLMSQGSGKKTQDTFALPAVVPTKRGGKAGATKMVYYPKPIPPPEVLPITRTSKDKEFPRYSNAFSLPGADIRRPASRIVDQRNLIDETKLVLYREKPKPKREGPSTTERRFRRMLERDRTLSSTSSEKKLRKSFVMAKNLARVGGDNTKKKGYYYTTLFFFSCLLDSSRFFTIFLSKISMCKQIFLKILKHLSMKTSNKRIYITNNLMANKV
ncbi:hypothetical protein LOTGIDRAFT_174088 [Lottia gigantea]|uniref:Uncharacterized protein n=1 Tax=Lottia gigantea TaxID=225164 RepID=V4AYB4_LOTGI|nr:hypothetical protein LOTGIDRAFT_174088 [Lottia gigantea]ESO98616.1 hypothetical protein LOTGIDRAFT_174088 [Lottia gigantea]